MKENLSYVHAMVSRKLRMAHSCNYGENGHAILGKKYLLASLGKNLTTKSGSIQNG